MVNVQHGLQIEHCILPPAGQIATTWHLVSFLSSWKNSRREKSLVLNEGESLDQKTQLDGTSPTITLGNEFGSLQTYIRRVYSCPEISTQLQVPRS